MHDVLLQVKSRVDPMNEENRPGMQHNDQSTVVMSTVTPIKMYSY